MSRRGPGEGTIFKRSDGRWVAALTERGADGRRRRRVFYAATRREVARQLTDALRKRGRGLREPGERRRLRDYLNDWLESIEPSIRPSTWRRYEQLLRLHAIPQLGDLRLGELTADHLQRRFSTLRKEGQSASSVNQLRAVLHRALGQAVDWDLVGRNVVDATSRIRTGKHEIQPLSADESRRLLQAAEGDELEPLYVLALTTGMRLGELLALRWDHVDLDAKRLQVRATLQRVPGGVTFGEPKSARSRRVVYLTESAVAALRRHRARQAELRLQLGGIWERDDLVFTNDVGGILSETYLRRRSFRPLLERAGLRPIRFHDLRHTAATLLLSRGVHQKIVSEMLGHSTVSITLDLYSHVTPAMHQGAADTMQEILTG